MRFVRWLGGLSISMRGYASWSALARSPETGRRAADLQATPLWYTRAAPVQVPLPMTGRIAPGDGVPVTSSHWRTPRQPLVRLGFRPYHAPRERRHHHA